MRRSTKQTDKTERGDGYWINKTVVKEAHVQLLYFSLRELSEVAARRFGCTGGGKAFTAATVVSVALLLLLLEGP